MKRMLFALALSVISLCCLAQEKQLLKEALERGVNSYGYYHIVNSKDKSTNLNKMSAYLRKEGYIILGGNEKIVRRFGDVSYILDYYNFTDHDHYQDYMFSALSKQDASTYREMRNKGSFYTVKEGKTSKGISGKTIRTTKYDMLTRNDDAMWTGNVRNGMIEGSGFGLMINNDGAYVWFKGEFANGIPVSNILMRIAKRNGDGTIKGGISSDKNEPLSLLACAYNLANADSQLSSALKTYLSIRYQENGKAIEAAYQNARSITISNCANFKPDEIVPSFIACYEKVGNDPQNYLAKAREVAKVYQVLPALKLNIREQYYGFNLWSILSLNWEWFSSYEEADRNCLSEGLEISKWGKSNSMFGFYNFFSQAYTNIQSKYNQFDSKISIDREKFRRKYDQQARANKNRREEYEREMAQHGHEIDWSRCEEPSGDLVKTNVFNAILGGGQYSFENEGIIKLKNGNRYKYNIIFNSEREFDYYEVTGARIGYQKFKSRGEMIDGIVKAERR